MALKNIVLPGKLKTDPKVENKINNKFSLLQNYFYNLIFVTMDVLLYRQKEGIVEHASTRGCQRVIKNSRIV